VSPAAALSVGLKVDADALRQSLVEDVRAGRIDLNGLATTLTLLKLNALVGVSGFFNSDGGLIRHSGKIYLLGRVNGSITVLNNNAVTVLNNNEPYFFGLAEVTPEQGSFFLMIGDALLAVGLRLRGIR
jgi:hypothetical protein